jgi:hypothetical protein
MALILLILILECVEPKALFECTGIPGSGTAYLKVMVSEKV